MNKNFKLNMMMSYRTECTIFLKVPPELIVRVKSNGDNGEVDHESILDQKEQTKSYWESKMLGVVPDEGGWESVANVKFQVEGVIPETTDSSVPPPPEFCATNEDPNFDNASQDSMDEFIAVENALLNPRPTRQYMYGVTEEVKPAKKVSTLVVRPLVSSTNTTAEPRKGSKENLIEAEIREQQLKEEALRRSRDKTGGASSPSSHVSDEGFVDRTPEEIPSPPSSTQGGFTHTLHGANGEQIIYDAVSPPSEFFSENSSDSETKIALEIRDLKEREAELRALREMREREQQLRSILPRPSPEEVDEDVESSSSRDDQLVSLTATTDEGNYSEYGDHTSEDKSSNGSNSRIMSPDLSTYSHAESRQRKPAVTVKPFHDEDLEEEQPVYTRMKNESVIEREIRLSKERDEAYRKEKGFPLAQQKSNTKKSAPKCAPSEEHNASSVAVPKVDSSDEGSTKIKGNGVQYRIANCRIQQEIEETARRERKLQTAGKIKTLSVDTVDSKIATTSLADRALEYSSKQDLTKSSAQQSTPQHKKLAVTSSLSSSPYSPPNFTPSPAKRPPAPVRLTRSLSTTNLSMGGGSLPPQGHRAPQKGLMQKFFANRGKVPGTTFVSSSTTKVNRSATLTSNGIPTRPMKVMPKAPVVRQEVESKMKSNEPPKLYKRTQVTAEEKIQEELREMKQREEELRRLRARNLARSQPNLAGLGTLDDDDDFDDYSSEGVDSSSFLHEMNGLRSALSNPNLLEDQEPQAPQSRDKGVRRKSALIAQWEGRIQQTVDTV